MSGAPQSGRDRALGSIGEPLLELRHLSRGREFTDISLVLRRGEIVVLTGLIGAGRTELLETIFGARRPGSGEILVRSKAVQFASPRDAIRSGIALLPEDRRGQGLTAVMPVFANITLASLGKFRSPLYCSNRDGIAACAPHDRRSYDKDAESLPGGRTAVRRQSTKACPGQMAVDRGGHLSAR